MIDSKEIREVYRRIKTANNKLIEAFAKKHTKDMDIGLKVDRIRQ